MIFFTAVCLQFDSCLFTIRFFSAKIVTFLDLKSNLILITNFGAKIVIVLEFWVAIHQFRFLARKNCILLWFWVEMYKFDFWRENCYFFKADFLARKLLLFYLKSKAILITNLARKLIFFRIFELRCNNFHFWGENSNSTIF